MTAKMPEKPHDGPHTVEDERAFRQVLGQFATGVTVMTTVDGDRPIGVTANSFSSLSLDPRLILWSIRKQSSNLAPFTTGTHFAVNILASDQMHLSQTFAVSRPDKFEGVQWSSGMGGAPVLDGVLASLECALETVHDGGDHVILVGRVLRYAVADKKPLLFVQGRYAVATEPPLTGKSSQAGEARAGLDFPQGPTLLSLLNRAQERMAEMFGKIRAAQNVSYIQSRILSAVDRHPCLPFDRLVSETLMGRRELEDVIGELIEAGFLEMSDQGLQLTDEGRARREAIGHRWLQFQAERMEGLSEDDLATARRVLKHLADKP